MKVQSHDEGLGVIFPLDIQEHLGIKEGDEITFTIHQDGWVSIKKVLPEYMDEEFKEGLDDLIERYDNTLKNLAKR